MATIPVDREQTQWSQPGFWKDLAPALHVMDQDFISGLKMFGVDGDSANALRTLINTEGYVQLPPLEWALPMDEMVALATKLDAQGIPIPFAFIYDEFWILFLKIHNLIEPLLGPGYFRLPDFWAWFVDPRRGDAGWSPHRDKAATKCLREDGSPLSVTVWIPLTTTNPLNGCMYMVPADRDPTYNTPDQAKWRFEYQDVRALPAEAGSLFIWNQAVLHWGSRTNKRETRPRISAAFEFQAADAPPFNKPLMAPNSIPLFGFRLQLIAKQILQYKHMYPLSPEMKEIAEQLLRTPAA